MSESILGKAHTDGYQAGWSQAAQISYDDAHEQGRIEGWSQGSKVSAWQRLCWFAFGCLIGAGFTWGLT